MACPMCKESHEISACPRWRVPVILSALLLSGCATIPGLEITAEDRVACEQQGCLPGRGRNWRRWLGRRC